MPLLIPVPPFGEFQVISVLLVPCAVGGVPWVACQVHETYTLSDGTKLEVRTMPQFA